MPKKYCVIVRYARLHGGFEEFWQIRRTEGMPVFYVHYECSLPEERMSAEQDLGSVTLDGQFRPEHDFDVKSCRNVLASHDCNV